MLFRGAASSGWNVALLRSQALAGMFESRNFYCWSNNVLQASSTYPIAPSGLEQMLVTGVGLIPSGFGPGQLFAYGTKQERLPLPQRVLVRQQPDHGPTAPGPGEQPGRAWDVLSTRRGDQHRRHGLLGAGATEHAGDGGLEHDRFAEQLADDAGSAVFLPCGAAGSGSDGAGAGA